MAFVFVSQVKKEGDKDGVLQNYRAVHGLWKDETQEKCVGVVCKDGATSLLFHQRQKNNKFVIGGGKYNLNDDVGLVKFSERLYHYLRLTISSE
ncbi:hypothetical protein GBAR_LOCUS1468 [Geodia barretti]|uniref:Uncharacterized protein n=1 Tax=Geodia barretti TaxID=519541 RepID=A0AA35QXK2_GEOBA|nr:hypothetical protein GBAR_LOCUS1468 [Geodia barretti]